MSSPKTELPDDITNNEVLTRLPVKSLMRFKCVCKTWCSLIANPEFVKNHLNRQLYAHQKLAFSVEEVHISVDLRLEDLEETGNISGVSAPVLRDLPFGASHVWLAGSCNGLICIRFANGSSHRINIGLWNPSTRECKNLPTPTSSLTPYNSKCCVVHDWLADDYKVLRVKVLKRAHPADDHYLYHVDIYSLRSDSWKIIKDHQLTKEIHRSLHRLDHPHPPIALNGSIYWPDEFNEHDIKAIKFDISEEKFGFTPPLPQTYESELVTRMQIFRGCLALILMHKKPSQIFDVWMMEKNEKGIHTWTKLMTTFPNSVSLCHHFYVLSVKNWKVIMYGLACNWKSKGSKKDYALYDVSGNRSLVLYDTVFSWPRMLYVESLVSPHSVP